MNTYPFTPLGADQVSQITQWRHTTKAYDPSRQIPQDQIEALKLSLQMSASSVNSQPWHIILASSEEAKDRIAKAGSDEKYAFNSPSIRNASHVALFAGRLSIDDDHLERLLDAEEKSGRFGDQVETRRQEMDGARRFFINIHKHDLKDVQHWMDKQVYLNMGQFMLSAAMMGIDTTPMEGIDIPGLDAEFGLREKGYSALALVCLGYHSDEDYNADLPKSRLPMANILTGL